MRVVKSIFSVCDRIEQACLVVVVVCVHCRFLQSIVSDERVLITAASIQWVSELMFVPHSTGSESLAAVGSLFFE